MCTGSVKISDRVGAASPELRGTCAADTILPLVRLYGYQIGSFFMTIRSATMLLVRQYFRIPSAPPEREPTPDSFQPPIGTGNWKMPMSTLLMLTVPVLICRASAIALVLSRVQTLPDKPEPGVVGLFDRLGRVTHLHHGQGGAERLLTHAVHFVVDVDQHRRLIEESPTAVIVRLAAGEHLRALPYCVVVWRCLC